VLAAAQPRYVVPLANACCWRTGFRVIPQGIGHLHDGEVPGNRGTSTACGGMSYSKPQQLPALRIVGAVMAVPLLVGCSSSTPTKAHPPTTTTAPSPTPSASVAKLATASQFASVIAAGQSGVDAAYAAIADCGPLYDPTNIPCSLGQFTYGLSVETIGVMLEGALAVGGPKFLGEPPSELISVIADSQAAFKRMKVSEDAYNKVCAGTDTPACDKVMFDWGTAQLDVTSSLAAWSPYTH
jgi:hypothetical protein